MLRRTVLALLLAAGLLGCSDDDGGTVDTGDVTTTTDPDVETGDTTPTTEAE